MLNMFSRCPACGSALTITECQCSNCRLQLRGVFEPGPFSRLSAEQLAFVGVFLRARGNLTEVERTLGVSYPTIRNKLDEVNSVLEGTAEKQPPSSPENLPETPENRLEVRQRILQKVAEKKLTATEAIQMLDELKRKE